MSAAVEKHDVMFPQELRHHCRHPRCRAKLRVPVENKRSAFCCRGCHRQFYHARCMVCEHPMERASTSQKLCGRRGCRSEFESLKAHFALGRYHTSPDPVSASGNPMKQGVSERGKGDRGWRQVAGAALSETDLRLATAGIEYAARADRANRQHWNDRAVIKRTDAPVNIIGGYRFANAPEIPDVLVRAAARAAN